MKRSRFPEAQVAFLPRHAEEGTKVEEVCRKAGSFQPRSAPKSRNTVT